MNDNNINNDNNNITNNGSMQSTLNAENNNISNNTSTIIQNSEPSIQKKSPKGIIIVIASIVILVGIVASVFFLLNGKKDIDGNNNQKTANNENAKSGDECKGTNNELTNLKGNNVGYYYNIDTSKFDKSKYNGKIHFFGDEIEGKITTNKLKNLGIEISYFKKETTKTGHTNFKSPSFSIDTTADIINADLNIPELGGDLSLVDYTGGSELYSDTTLLLSRSSFGFSLTGRNIYPSQLGINNYKDITIDLLLEKLGNPTYVYERVSSCLKSINTYTTYVYVYDDVVFLFAFYNWRNMLLAGNYYFPIDQINGNVEVVERKRVKDESGTKVEEIKYKNYLEYLEKKNEEYLSSK